MKIFILDGDHIEQALTVPDDRFLFIKTKDGKLYHLDGEDCKMWQAQSAYSNLGKNHQMLFASQDDIKIPVEI